MTESAENGLPGCEHGVAMSQFCSACVGFNPVTCGPACDWCGESDCGFCARQSAPIPPGEATP